MGWDFFVAGGQRIVSSCWRRPREAEQELTLGEPSPCSGRARTGGRGEGARGSCRLGRAGRPRAACRGRAVGSGLQAPGRARGRRLGPAGG